MKKRPRVPVFNEAVFDRMEQGTLTANPFQSQSQRAACYAADDPAWDCEEWESHTSADKKLPKRKKGKRPTANARRKKNRHRKRPPNPLRIDPSRTLTIRRAFIARLRRQFAKLKGDLFKLLVVDDEFGLKDRVHEVGEMARNYDPNQERDEQGRWAGSRSFASIKGASAEEKQIIHEILRHAEEEIGAIDVGGKHISVGKTVPGKGDAEGSNYSQWMELKKIGSKAAFGGRVNAEDFAYTVAHELVHHAQTQRGLSVSDRERHARLAGGYIAAKWKVSKGLMDQATFDKYFKKEHLVGNTLDGRIGFNSLGVPGHLVYEAHPSDVLTNTADPTRLMLGDFGTMDWQRRHDLLVGPDWWPVANASDLLTWETLNQFCPTGPGGGIDATCSPNKGERGRMIHSLRETGGFTYVATQEKYQRIGQEGYAVSPYPERSAVFDKRVTRGDLRKFMQDNAELLAKPGHAVGAWYDPDGKKTYLDVSIVTENKDEAIRLGREHNQIAVFDFKSGSTVATGGTGEATHNRARRGGDGRGAGRDAGEPLRRRTGIDVLHNEFNPDQARDPDGRFASGSASANSMADRVLSFARSLPRAAVERIKTKVKEKYAKLERRYGPGYSKAIIGAALLGLPVPLPGASFASAAVVIGVAELHRMVSGGPKATANEEWAMTEDEVQVAAQELIAELTEELAGAEHGDGIDGSLRGSRVVWDGTANANDFFATCERDEKGHCMAGDGGSSVSLGRAFPGITTKIAEDGSLTGEGRVDDKTNLAYLSISKANGITPEEVDGEFEMEAIHAAMEETRAFWASTDPDARAIRKTDFLTGEANDPEGMKASLNIIMTADKSNAGAGSGGPGSARVFWTPYSLPNREARLENYATSLGVDPIYVLAHELHHAYGHGSELDNASDVAAVAAHLKTGMKFNRKPAESYVFNQVAVLQYNIGKDGKLDARANAAGRRLRYLHKKFPEQLKKAAMDNVVHSEEEWQQVVNRFSAIGKPKPKQPT